MHTVDKKHKEIKLEDGKEVGDNPYEKLGKKMQHDIYEVDEIGLDYADISKNLVDYLIFISKTDLDQLQFLNKKKIK